MIVTAYMDESGTHGSETMLISAYAAKAGQWRRWETRARKHLDRYNVAVFHAKEWWDSDGCFKGWSMDKKVTFLDEFAYLTNEELEFGCIAVLKISDYKAYYANDVRPRRARVDTAYGVCFRAALGWISNQTMLHVSDEWPPNKKRYLHVVLEQGAKNAPDAVRVFDDYKSTLVEQYTDKVCTMTFARKQDCVPLAIVDFLAFGVFRDEEGLPKKMKARAPTKSDEVYRGNFYRLGIERKALLTLKRNLMEDDAKLCASRR